MCVCASCDWKMLSCKWKKVQAEYLYEKKINLKEASHISQSYYVLAIIHVTLKYTGHTYTQTTLQKHIRILPFCLHHDPKYITESIIDD